MCSGKRQRKGFCRIENRQSIAGAILSRSQGLRLGDGYFRAGRQDGPADLRMRIGHCTFGSPDAALLVSLLPQVVLARGEARLVTLMQLISDETRAQRPARELVLERLALAIYQFASQRRFTELTRADHHNRGCVRKSR